MATPTSLYAAKLASANQAITQLETGTPSVVLDGDSFKEAERLAEVPHLEGRAAYGLRRAAVDAAKEAGISREGLQAHGGWTDSQIPDRVYADQQAGYARDEARRVRAKIRGEE